jgi:hypothetical protein
LELALQAKAAYSLEEGKKILLNISIDAPSKPRNKNKKIMREAIDRYYGGQDKRQEAYKDCGVEP